LLPNDLSTMVPTLDGESQNDGPKEKQLHLSMLVQIVVVPQSPNI